MIGKIIITIVRLFSKKVGENLGNKALEKGSQKRIDLNEFSEYTMKLPNVTIYASVFMILLCLGLSGIAIWYVYDFNGDANSVNLATLCLCVFCFLFFLGFYIYTVKYRVRFTNVSIIKKTLFKEHEFRWDDITGIYVEKNAYVVFTKEHDQMKFKFVLTGIAELLYFISIKFGKQVIYNLSSDLITQKHIIETVKRYEIDFDDGEKQSS